jgi:hypothetical protein
MMEIAATQCGKTIRIGVSQWQKAYDAAKLASHDRTNSLDAIALIEQ